LRLLLYVGKLPVCNFLESHLQYRSSHFWNLIWICIEIQQQRLLFDHVLSPTDFQHSSNRLSQRITKLYCGEMSEELFPVYHDRRASDRTFNRNLCWENRCKTGKPCKESAFVATTAKLYLLISINLTDDSRLDCSTASMLSVK
ncbi:hypothetical protein T08_15340, partial [Trichinella sp. T8]